MSIMSLKFEKLLIAILKVKYFINFVALLILRRCVSLKRGLRACLQIMQNAVVCDLKTRTHILLMGYEK
jgi:hypothetical protein